MGFSLGSRPAGVSGPFGPSPDPDSPGSGISEILEDATRWRGVGHWGSGVPPCRAGKLAVVLVPRHVVEGTNRDPNEPPHRLRPAGPLAAWSERSGPSVGLPRPKSPHGGGGQRVDQTPSANPGRHVSETKPAATPGTLTGKVVLSRVDTTSKSVTIRLAHDATTSGCRWRAPHERSCQSTSCGTALRGFELRHGNTGHPVQNLRARKLPL